MDGLLDELKEYARAGHNFSGANEIRRLQQCVEQLKHVCERRCSSVIDAATELPLLYTYANDATSYVCMSIRQFKHTSGMRTARKGRQLYEFLLERSYVV